ncbi:hypothetical protein Q1695_013150 [Nippostrongylus brasiliensis]|nr:hypothetical protein Q1695_013150 [Nippostrongylus brasiliensis]
MVFYLIGLGLGDVEDITVKGLKIVRKCKRVHLEAYTSILCYGLDKTKLEEFYGREVIEADRTVVEQNADEILDGADVDDIAMLVVGDPFGATTHTDLVLRAKQRNIEVKVIHNTSIMNAVGCCGLQLYNFGETVSIVMWLDGWEPDSYYDKIASNMEKGFHTLCLLDIKTKEQSIENMMKGRKIYEPPRYLTCAEAASQLLKIAERKKQAGVEPVYNESSPCVGLARVGWDNQKIVYCTLKEMSECDLGPPLHSMILPGNMHPLEIDMLNTFRLIAKGDEKENKSVLQSLTRSSPPTYADGDIGSSRHKKNDDSNALTLVLRELKAQGSKTAKEFSRIHMALAGVSDRLARVERQAQEVAKAVASLKAVHTRLPTYSSRREQTGPMPQASDPEVISFDDVFKKSAHIAV